MEIWCPTAKYASKLAELLKAEGFDPEFNGRRIRVPISAFSFRAELLFPYRDYLAVTLISQTSFEYDFPREAGVYNHKGARISVEEVYFAVSAGTEYIPCQFFQGTSDNLEDLMELYFAIKAGEIPVDKSWDIDHDTGLKKRIIKEAEKEINKNQNEDDEGQKEP